MRKAILYQGTHSRGKKATQSIRYPPVQLPLQDETQNTTYRWSQQHHHQFLHRQLSVNNQSLMNKEIIHTAPNGKKYSIQIRKYTPRDCFRLMGVHEADIDKLLSKEKTGQLIICKSKLYALAGNSIVTNCLTAMFEELIFPSGNHYHDKTGQLSLF